MKKFFLLILVTLMCTTFINAAYTQETAPFNEEYLLVYNASVKKDPEVALQNKNVVTNVNLEEKNGEMLYQTEMNLEQIKVNKDNVNLFGTADFENNLSVGQTRTFLVKDGYKGVYENVGATFAFKGEFCDVFVETVYWNNGINSEMVSKVATEFATKIRPTMISDFGDYTGYTKNGKIAIFLYDIRDAHYYGKGKSYTGGFFYSGDLFTIQDGGTGNLLPIINVDINPLMGSKAPFDVSKGFSTIVHEFQHMINYSDYYMNWQNQDMNNIWWNEMFSMAAEHLVYGTLKDRIMHFNGKYENGQMISYDGVTPINEYAKNGSVLNYLNYNENQNDMVANYSIPYLFGQYLRTQTKNYVGGGNEIYHSIMLSNKNDENAIIEALKNIKYPINDFATLNKNFRIATFLLEQDGIYSFGGESDFYKLQAPIYEKSATKLNLKGTAAVIMKTEPNIPFNPGTHGANIKYIGFQKTNPYLAEGIYLNIEKVENLNEKIYVELAVTNNFATNNFENVNIVVAVYNENNKILEIKSLENTLYKGQKYDLTFEFANYYDKYQIKAFALKNKNISAPLCVMTKYLFGPR